MIRVHVEVERNSRSAVERGDFMKTLQEALKTGESIDIEFKSWIKASNMRERISLAVDELIAFANCKGGTVYFGVEDNGEVTGCTGKYDLQSIQEAIYDKTSPHLFTEIEEIEYDGKTVFYEDTVFSKLDNYLVNQVHEEIE